MRTPYSSSASIAFKSTNVQLAHLYKRLAHITEKAQQEHAAGNFEAFISETQRLSDLVIKLSRIFQNTPDTPAEYETTANAWGQHFTYLLMLINQFNVDPAAANACKLKDYFISMHTTWLEMEPREAPIHAANAQEPNKATPQPVTLTV
jgi:hypothetical protein